MTDAPVRKLSAGHVVAALAVAVAAWLAQRNHALETRIEALEQPSASTGGAATSQRTPAALPPPVETAPAAPERTFAPLDAKAILVAWETLAPRVRAHCADHVEDAVAIEVTLELDERGGVIASRPEGSGELAACVARVLTHLQFPRADRPSAGTIALPWGPPGP